MKFSCCIDMMFSHLDFYDRFSAVKKAGLSAVEFWKWSPKDIDRVKSLLAENGLALSVMNIDVSDEKLSYDLSRGILNAGRSDEFCAAIKESAPVVRKLGNPKLIVLIGETIEEMSVSRQEENVFSCLKEGAKVAEDEGVHLVVEPLNAYDRKNYFMPDSKRLFEILRGVGSENVKALFDIYHQQKTEGNVIERIEENIDLIGHFHVADNPGRHEPGTGEINYKNVLTKIASLPYLGYVGLEYRATRRDEETLGFTKEV